MDEERPINVSEYRERARARLDGNSFDYYRSGAHDEITLRDNRAAWERRRLAYRVLVDVRSCDTTTRVLGARLRAPLIVAPTAFQRLAHPDGELATVRAAGAVGSVMILSSLSTVAVDEVVAAATGPVWFQLYVYHDRAITAALVAQAEAAGCQAIVLTVDAPRLGRRERDVRNRFHLPPGVSAKNLLPAGYGAIERPDHDSGLAVYFGDLIDPGLTWDDIAWLRGLSSLPLVLKGIVRADDAARAVEHGVDGIVISNHGGRQLDTALATLDALAPIAAAVDGRIPILIDGGVRRGTDVVKALALGARAVCVGRPVLWGLAVDGEAGVAHVLELLREEFELAMALCGARTVAELTRDLVV